MLGDGPLLAEGFEGGGLLALGSGGVLVALGGSAGGFGGHRRGHFGIGLLLCLLLFGFAGSPAALGGGGGCGPLFALALAFALSSSGSGSLLGLLLLLPNTPLVLLQSALHIELVLELLEPVGQLSLALKLGHLLEPLPIGLVLDEAGGIKGFHVELFNVLVEIVVIIVVIFFDADGLLFVFVFVFRGFLHIVIGRSWLAQLLASATTSSSRSSRSLIDIHGIIVVVTVVTAVAIGHGRHAKVLAA